MEFNATAQALKCPNCGREVKIENNPKDVVEHSLDVHILKTIKVSEKTSTSMECEGCGAMVEVDATSSATTCPYCGSHYVLSKKQIESIVPDGVIPFKELTSAEKLEEVLNNIKVGDTLVELDTEDLEKKVNEIKESIAQEQKTLTRATEDYNKAINAKKQAVQGALNEMNTAKQALDNYSKLSDEEKDPGIEESLYSDYQSKKSMYDAAVSESNDTVDLDRALQDTKDSLKIDEYNKELAKLQPLLEAGGKITSEKEGIITSVFAENGGVTTDTIASIADKNEGYKFIGEIDKENRTSIKQGQVVALNLGTYGIIENLTIASISKNQDNNETLNVTVVLPVGIGEIDDSGEIVVSSKSRKYGTCVPLAALRQGDGNSYYVLVVTEKETVLGKELIAKKVDVKIEKRDGEYAAVTEGALGRNDKIIIDSNKTIEDGDRVRLETE